MPPCRWSEGAFFAPEWIAFPCISCQRPGISPADYNGRRQADKINPVLRPEKSLMSAIPAHDEKKEDSLPNPEVLDAEALPCRTAPAIRRDRGACGRAPVQKANAPRSPRFRGPCRRDAR